MEFTKDIQFNQKPISNQSISLTYTGFLGNSSELSIVYGFGESWENTTEQKMQKIENGFTTTINLMDFDTFNFCFKNQDEQWDNNSNCNYITPIFEYKPDIEKIQTLFDELCSANEEQTTITFDIDSLIEEILQPIVEQSFEEIEDPSISKITEQPIDLGAEISKILSEIDYSAQPVLEFSSLDEILSGTVINSESIEKFEGIEEVEELEIIEKPNKIEEITENTETSLVNVKDEFIISPRQLSKFYLFRKRIKLAFYKALVKLPKLIFGLDEQ